MEYKINLTADDNGTFMVTCPDLPEVTTFGDSEADALAYAVSGVEEALAARLADFEDIPRPSGAGDHSVQVPMQLALKVLLKWALDDKQSNRNQLAIAMGKKRPQIDRLFDPHHGTKVDQFEAAAQALGSKFMVELR